MSYYKTVKGKKLDKELLDLAEKSVSGKGDGRISLSDAKLLFAAVKDGNKYTDVEKKTMEYIRDNYKFTESADKWFRTEIRKWAASRKSPTPKPTSDKPKLKKETPPKEDKTEVIPLIEEIKGTEAVIPPPTIPRMEAIPEVQTPQEKKKFPWIWIVLLILLLILFFFFWRYGCGKVGEKEPVQQDSKEEPKGKDVPGLPEFSFEDLEKTRFGFQKGNAELSPESYPTVEKIVELLKSKPEWKLKIMGHSCDTGSEETNAKISKKRAESVKKLLVKQGIDAGRIQTEGKGESEPLAENDTEENRAKNRRVQFKLLK